LMALIRAAGNSCPSATIFMPRIGTSSIIQCAPAKLEERWAPIEIPKITSRSFFADLGDLFLRFDFSHGDIKAAGRTAASSRPRGFSVWQGPLVVSLRERLAQILAVSFSSLYLANTAPAVSTVFNVCRPLILQAAIRRSAGRDDNRPPQSHRPRSSRDACKPNAFSLLQTWIARRRQTGSCHRDRASSGWEGETWGVSLCKRRGRL